jgi:hypothetical protein
MWLDRRVLLDDYSKDGSKLTSQGADNEQDNFGVRVQPTWSPPDHLVARSVIISSEELSRETTDDRLPRKNHQRVN